MNVTRLKVSLHVVVVMAVPRGKDDSVVLGRTEMDHDVVGVTDLRRLYVDLQVLLTTERHYWRI